jgi:hypothetical protein
VIYLTRAYVYTPEDCSRGLGVDSIVCPFKSTGSFPHFCCFWASSDISPVSLSELHLPMSRQKHFVSRFPNLISLLQNHKAFHFFLLNFSPCVFETPQQQVSLETPTSHSNCGSTPTFPKPNPGENTTIHHNANPVISCVHL